LSTRADERDAPVDHWVTINGNHVPILEPQGGSPERKEPEQKPQQEQPVTSVTILGKKVIIVYPPGLSAEEELRISKKIVAAADLLNKNADSQHYLNKGKYSGENLWRGEESASTTQLGIGNKIGFTTTQKNDLQNYMKDRAQMQKHMMEGLRY